MYATAYIFVPIFISFWLLLNAGKSLKSIPKYEDLRKEAYTIFGHRVFRDVEEVRQELHDYFKKCNRAIYTAGLYYMFCAILIFSVLFFNFKTPESSNHSPAWLVMLVVLTFFLGFFGVVFATSLDIRHLKNEIMRKLTED